MTLPLPGFQTPAIRANWFDRYAEVEKGFDRSLFNALEDARKGIDKKLVSLVGNDNISVQTRRLQLSLAHKEIRKQMEGLFGDVDGLIKSHRANAAEAAVNAALKDEDQLLSRLFPDKVSREAYADSLRATARRNIDATVTRVLETELPLSRRVYKTKALANGLVSTAINTALARGDSAADLARAVSGLIDPSTPGGVSYAAKRLGRTEINNAFHAQSIHDAQDKPWIDQMRWHLSKRHSDYPGDPCEDYAEVGLYPIEHVPNKPHPNCRCYVTPEEPDPETFELGLIQGHYDEYLDARLGFKPEFEPTPEGALAMEAAPLEGATTKAAQPKGWTGPPVAKAAANQQVRDTTDQLWHKYAYDKSFMQAARQGARTVQVKGYRGGLSAQGKKDILAQIDTLIANERIAIDIGREMTARMAYAQPSKESVYRVLHVSAEDMAKLRKGPDISMPLSTWERNINNAFDVMAEPPPGANTVVFELADGAKLAEAGDSRVTLGHMKLESITERHAPTGGKYHVVRLRQMDAREFEAPQVKQIPEFEYVPKGKERHAIAAQAEPAVEKPVVPKPEAPKPEQPQRFAKADWKEVDRRLTEANRMYDVIITMQDNFPHIKFTNFDKASLETAKGIAKAVNDMEDRFPIHAISEVHVDNLVQTHGPKFSNAYAVTSVERIEATGMMSDSGYFATRWKGRIGFNTEHMRTTNDLAESYTHSIRVGFHPSYGNKVVVSDEEAARSIMIHEIGHAVDDRLMYDLRDNAKKVVDTAWKKYQKANRGWEPPVTKKQFITESRPSRYSLQPTKLSTSNSKVYIDTDKIEPPEFVAEAIADVVGNGYENAAPLSQAMWDYIEENWDKPRVFMPGQGTIPDSEFITTGRSIS